MKKLLAVSADPFEQKLKRSVAAESGFEIFEAGSFKDASALLQSCRFDVAIVDLELEQGAGFRLLDELYRLHPRTTVVVLAGAEALRCLEAKSSTATILLRRPLPNLLVARLLQYLKGTLGANTVSDPHALVGISSGVAKLRQLITALKDWPHSVLIHGETGTGKELVAHALHTTAAGRKGPFITVDCGAISPSLIENELFGHAKGAYTGASSAQRGLVLAANGGTLFLDEIGDLPLDCQSRLLRLLQEKEVRPIGDTRSIPVDVRVCAATNVNLEAAVRERRFREDLYYRLSPMALSVPSLRERRDDISLLAAHFLRCAGIDKRLSLDALARMHSYRWPGNVRELQNKILRGVALADRDIICADDLDLTEAPQEAFEGTLASLERDAILGTLAKANNDVIEAARRLGIGKTTLYRRLRVYRS